MITPKLSAFARQGILVFAAQMAVNLSNFLFHATVSRRIGVEEYGTLNALVSGFNIFAVVAVTLGTVVAKVVAELRSAGATGRIRNFALQTFVILSSVALLSLFLTWLSARGIAGYLHISATSAVLVTGAILALNFVLPLRGILQGAEMFGSYSISLVLEAVLKVALALLFVWIGFGLVGALGGWLAGAGIALIYTIAVVTIRFGRTDPNAYHLDTTRIGLAMAGTVAAGILLAVMQFSDVIIVKHFFNPEQAGLYAAAALAGRMLFLLVNFVPIILIPHAVRAAHDGTKPERFLLKAVLVVLGISLIALIGYGLFPTFIIGTLAGSAFKPAASLLFPYAIAATTFAILNTVVTYRIGIHRMQFLWPLSLLAIAEIVAIWEFHRSGLGVIEILIIGNLVGTFACLIGIRQNKPQVAR